MSVIISQSATMFLFFLLLIVIVYLCGRIFVYGILHQIKTIMNTLESFNQEQQKHNQEEKNEKK
jgi:predicted PurR-regulated permease PerM